MISVIAIFITGPSSTGKTTLCEALKKYLENSGFSVFHVAEVARTVMREQGFTREHVDTLEMQRAIMLAQTKKEKLSIEDIEHLGGQRKRHIVQLPFVLLCDRCAVDPVVYATMHLDPSMVMNLRSDASFRKAVDYYRQNQVLQSPSGERLVIQPTVILADGVEEWKGIDDGVRSLYDPWKVAEAFRPVLKDLGIRYHEIGEGIKELDRRVDWVVDIVGLRPFVSQKR